MLRRKDGRRGQWECVIRRHQRTRQGRGRRREAGVALPTRLASENSAEEEDRRRGGEESGGKGRRGRARGGGGGAGFLRGFEIILGLVERVGDAMIQDKSIVHDSGKYG